MNGTELIPLDFEANRGGTDTCMQCRNAIHMHTMHAVLVVYSVPFVEYTTGLHVRIAETNTLLGVEMLLRILGTDFSIRCFADMPW